MLNSQDQDNPRSKRRQLIRIWASALFMIAAITLGVASWLRNEASVLIVTSTPIGAEVVLNYRPTDILTNAYFSGLSADSFAVTLRLDGYRPVPNEQYLRLNAGDTSRVTFIMAPVNRGDERLPARADGLPYKWQWKKVRVNSEPQGAEIIINDVPTGLFTPATVVFDRGLHHLQAHWPNGAKSYKNVLIEPQTSQPNILFRPATYMQPEK